ncbi:MAG TPA: CdaR family protein [Virgibacillus sp.]|nr:CdaR family protein [Virgibacillus sp.]
MDKWFKSKWFVRVISLAFAILLYVTVSVEGNPTQSDSRFIPTSSDDMETIDDVPVDIRIDEERFVVSGVPEYVSVSLEGANSILTPTVRQRNFNAYVDLEGLGEGEHTVEIEHENVPNGLTVYIEPKAIDVTIEERETKEFNVNVDFINTDQLPDGYELGDPVVDPETVTITSSKNVISQIAMVKVFVDVTDVTDAINKREVPVNVYDNQGNELKVHVEPETVLVSADVDNLSKTVAVNIATKGELPDEYELDSFTPDREEVEVFASSDKLDEIDEITTEEIDLSKIKESGTIETKLLPPDGVSVADDKIEIAVKMKETKKKSDTETDDDDTDEESDTDTEESVETETEAETSADPKDETENETKTNTIQGVPIEIENAGTDQSISFVNPGSGVMAITVEGDAEDVSKLSSENFRLFIDVSDRDEGEHQLPVTLEGPDGVTSSSEMEEVTIEITQ